jgi:hypothetical protein
VRIEAGERARLRSLILLVAACEQMSHELRQADTRVDGLGEDLEPLSSRLRDLLDEDRWKTPTP